MKTNLLCLCLFFIFTQRLMAETIAERMIKTDPDNARILLNDLQFRLANLYNGKFIATITSESNRDGKSNTSTKTVTFFGNVDTQSLTGFTRQDDTEEDGFTTSHVATTSGSFASKHSEGKGTLISESSAMRTQNIIDDFTNFIATPMIYQLTKADIKLDSFSFTASDQQSSILKLEFSFKLSNGATQAVQARFQNLNGYVPVWYEWKTPNVSFITTMEYETIGKDVIPRSSKREVKSKNSYSSTIVNITDYQLGPVALSTFSRESVGLPAPPKTRSSYSYYYLLGAGFLLILTVFFLRRRDGKKD